MILKWNVPIDDRWHPIGSGKVAHVGVQEGVMVWTIEEDPYNVVYRAARVFATGQPFERGHHVGTALDGPFVWHVIVGESL